MARLFQPRLIVGRRIRRNAPIERLILGIAFGEPPGDLGACKLGTEIERVRAVGAEVEPGIEIEDLPADVMAVFVIDVDAVLGDLDAEIPVAYGFGVLDDSSMLMGNGFRACSASSPSA
ncbi:MAG: hypothetical protein R3D01_14195 [Hyphomicrobiales bacterium]